MAGGAKEAEAVLAPRLSLAPVTAAIAVTLTPPPLSLEHLWACHSPGKEGAKERGKEGQKWGSVLREICRREGRHGGRRRSSGCGGGKTGKKGNDREGGGREAVMGRNAKSGRRRSS